LKIPQGRGLITEHLGAFTIVDQSGLIGLFGRCDDVIFARLVELPAVDESVQILAEL